MPGYAWEVCEDPIPGLRLPPQTWNVLMGAQIETLIQLSDPPPLKWSILEYVLRPT
jgi:hypothetical protein